MASLRDRKIGDVPHLETVTGDEKIPLSANGEPRYVEIKQIQDGLLTEEKAKNTYVPLLTYNTDKKELDERIEGIEGNQEADHGSITELQGKLNGVDNVLEELNKKADKTALQATQDEVAALKTNKADATRVKAIEDKIPSQASASNQLADKEFVNSSIATSTAEFKGTYDSLEELKKQQADANDYGFVISKDSDGNTLYNRYKYVEGTGWIYEYTLNNSSFTASQWAAIQSGITKELVDKWKLLPNASDILTHAQAEETYYTILSGRKLETQLNELSTDLSRVEGLIPSLEGYATEKWVMEQKYLTSVALSDITDVLLSDVKEGQVLSYEGGKWINADSKGGGGLTEEERAKLVTVDTAQTITGVKTFTSQLLMDGGDSSWYGGRDIAFIRLKSSIGRYSPIFSIKSAAGSWDCGCWSNNNYLYFSYIPDTSYEAKNNSQPAQIYFKADGLVAPSFIKSGGTSSQFLKADGSVDSNGYLPLSGGTLTGQLSMSMATGTDMYLVFKYGTANGGSVGYDSNGMYLWTAGSNKKLQWTTNGILNVPGQISSTVAAGTAPLSVLSNTLCTNLNADMLDGQHSSGFGRRMNLGDSTDQQPFYVVLSLASNGTAINGSAFYGSVELNRGHASAWNGKSQILVQCGGAYTSNVAKYQVLSSSVGVNGLYKILVNGTYYIALKIGATSVQTIYIHGEWTESFSPFVAKTGVTSEELLTNVPQIDSNSSSATKLQTARTLWGQSFDGSGNVDGTLRIQANTGSYCEGIRIKPYSGFSIILLGGTDLTATTGTSANSWGIFNRDGELYFNRGNSYTSTGYELCNVKGNWGVGTTSPSYKLHVVGTGYFTGYVDFVGGAGNSGSDMRFKSDIQRLPKLLSALMDIDIFSYHWNKSGERERNTFGLNASQLIAKGGVFARMVHERDDEYKTKWLDYDRVGVLALKGVQELYDIILRQDQRIKELERRVA